MGKISLKLRYTKKQIIVHFTNRKKLTITITYFYKQ